MWQQAAALVLFGSLMTACGDDGATDSSGGGTVLTETPSTTRSFSFAESDCTDPDYPLPLGVETDIAEEIEYLDDVVACTDDGQTTVWLLNRSDAVWEIYLGPKAGPYGQPTAFRTMFGDTAFAPGDAVAFPSATGL